MTASPAAADIAVQPENQLPLGELSRRLAAELAAAAALCRECETVAGELATGGAGIENVTRLQALDELSQRLHGLSDVLARIGQHASGEWSMSVEPLLEGLGLADLVVRLGSDKDHAGWGATAGELDVF